MQELKLVKNLTFGDTARSQVLAGVEKLTNAVGSTLGASGKCVILEDSLGKPQITKDGVTVANSITLQDPLQNIGATLIKQAAQRTVSDAGDGTTTATVLAKAILDQATEHSLLDDPRAVKEGIDSGVSKVIKYLNKKSRKVTGKKIDQVATISANNDKELGKVIGEAFRLVDETGVVMMETNEQPETVVELIEGVQYDRALKNNHFITNKEKGTAELENPLVLIVESVIPNVRKIQSVLEFIIKNGKSLLIIADVDPQVVSALAMNKTKGNIKVNIVDAPIYGISKKDVLSDLCAVTGATLINEDLGDDMDIISPDHLGSCIRSVTNHEETILQVDLSDNTEVKETVSLLERNIKETKNPNIIIRLEKRLAKLKAKVATVKVGANSEIELKEKRDRVEDAICATKAAIKEGIVPGGGIALLNASFNLKPTCIGEEVLYSAIRRPHELILNNAGISDIKKLEEGMGLDVVTGKTVDMVKAGIIDPLLVTKSALTNAASVATTILSTDCVINNIRA
uniref:Chaperonin GroEL n=1 Tax=uncultured marine virus TaxID=186617 RepID=A0A0F7LAS5_9VIRU|nr:chaperonin GroEL [uncultured marine virus]